MHSILSWNGFHPTKSETGWNQSQAARERNIYFFNSCLIVYSFVVNFTGSFWLTWFCFPHFMMYNLYFQFARIFVCFSPFLLDSFMVLAVILADAPSSISEWFSEISLYHFSITPPAFSLNHLSFPRPALVRLSTSASSRAANPSRCFAFLIDYEWDRRNSSDYVATNNQFVCKPTMSIVSIPSNFACENRH